jgi:flagellar FliL protein
MADIEAEGGAAAEGAEAAAPKSKFKLILIIVGALVVLGGGAAIWFLSFRHGDDEHHAEAAPPPKPPVFVDVPDIMVNLAGAPGERVQYLKLKIVLELEVVMQVEAIKPTMPRVTDIFQTYVHELRSSDLNGSAGIFRLKEELTKRVNAAVAPVQVSAVLFKEVVLQ